MKILFIDTRLNGHHLTYLNAILDECGDTDEVELVLPDCIETEQVMGGLDRITRCSLLPGFSGYLKWMKVIHRKIRQMKPDIVHFLYGDDLTRFFGFGLRSIARNARIVVTQHQIRYSILRCLSLRHISSVSIAFVVHTMKLCEDLQQLKMKHIVHIEYPYFGMNRRTLSKAEACQKIGVEDKLTPIVLAAGGTRYDKGLDILLEALNQVKQPFQLLVAGKEQHFTRAFIEEKSSAYSQRVKLMLQFLNDDLFEACLQAADVVVLPYRKVFDGASGPLGEAVKYNKMIVAPDNGSLGQIMKMWHLGMVFESESVSSLAQILSSALQDKWQPDKQYMAYKVFMSPERFRKEHRTLYERVLDVKIQGSKR